MNVKTFKSIGAVLCVAALAVPAGVSAKGPSDHGKSGQDHGKTKTHHVNSRCKKQPKVGFSLGGTLDPSSTADNVVVVVTKTNKHSKPFVVDGKYTVPAGSKVTFEGANPFTTPGADFSKYRVKVNGKVIKYKKGCNADTAPAPTVKSVKIHAPDTTPETPEQEAPALG
jgi:hypothetical protein